MNEYDAIVIGAGAAGSAAAWHLARMGSHVLLLERHALFHDLGSSHGESRIIRLTYGHPAYVALAREAYAGWEALERETDVVLLHRTGDLFFGPSEGPIAGYADALDTAKVPFARLSAAEAERCFPAFKLPEGFSALHQEKGGILPATRCVGALVEAALARGAEVRDLDPVREIVSWPSSIEVHTERAEYRAQRLVVAAGAWISKILPELKLPVRVTRQVVAYFKPSGPASLFRTHWMPVFVYLGQNEAADDFYYGVPIFGRFGVKVARHRTHGPGLDPDEVERVVTPQDLEDVRGFIGRYLPALAGAQAIEPHVCLYTVTPDEHFILDVHPEDPRIVVASPCSGHGFKFAPVVGRIVAELARDGRTDVAAFEENRALFSVGRFR